jgi:CDP-diacylglycerol--glycerol-3-phosphate 3-phosphatidyltransferase
MVDLEQAGRNMAERVVARTLARLPVSPLALTMVGAFLNVGVAALLAAGYLRWAAGLMLAAALFDAADGALARVTHRVSSLGGVLDSTLDRYSEILVGLGLMLYLLQRNAWPDVILLYLFMTGSLLFSYARARAEAAGFASRGGLFTRSVRVLLLAIGLLAGQVHITLWVLAVGVLVSAFFRFLGVCAEATGRPFPERAPAWLGWFKGPADPRALGEQDPEPPAVDGK